MRTFILFAVGTGLLAAALMCGCSALDRPASVATAPRSVPPAAGATLGRKPVIGVLFAGWHSGLILPVRELGPLRRVLPVFPHAHFVSFGWGDRRFYMSPQPTLADALAALFSSPSTMLVADAPTVQALIPSGGTYRWLCADRQEVRKIDAYLLSALHLSRGAPIDLGTGPWPDSEFLASSERYDAFHTCNTWTAEALEQAGLAIRAGGVIFAIQLQNRVSRLSECRHPFRTRHSVAWMRSPLRLRAPGA